MLSDDAEEESFVELTAQHPEIFARAEAARRGTAHGACRPMLTFKGGLMVDEDLLPEKAEGIILAAVRDSTGAWVEVQVGLLRLARNADGSIQRRDSDAKAVHVIDRASDQLFPADDVQRGIGFIYQPWDGERFDVVRAHPVMAPTVGMRVRLMADGIRPVCGTVVAADVLGKVKMSPDDKTASSRASPGSDPGGGTSSHIRAGESQLQDGGPRPEITLEFDVNERNSPFNSSLLWATAQAMVFLTDELGPRRALAEFDIPQPRPMPGQRLIVVLPEGTSGGVAALADATAEIGDAAEASSPEGSRSSSPTPVMPTPHAIQGAQQVPIRVQPHGRATTCDLRDPYNHCLQAFASVSAYRDALAAYCKYVMASTEYVRDAVTQVGLLSVEQQHALKLHGTDHELSSAELRRLAPRGFGSVTTVADLATPLLAPVHSRAHPRCHPTQPVLLCAEAVSVFQCSLSLVASHKFPIHIALSAPCILSFTVAFCREVAKRGRQRS